MTISNSSGPPGALTRRDFVAATGAVAALGPAVAQAASAPLVFWQFYAPGGPVQAQADWFLRLAGDWNAAHSPKIKLQYVPTDQYMNGSKLQTSFASGEGPDIFLISPGDFLRYANAGVLFDLSPYIDAATRRDFPSSVLAPRLVDGKILAIPMEVEPVAMFYSVAAFEKAGLNEHDVPTTWEQLGELGRKLTTPNRYGVLFDTTPGYYQNFTWYPFFWQGGGKIVGSNNKSQFASEAAIQALEFWRQLVKSGVSPRKTLGGGAWDIVPNLASGFCAIQNCGSWGISALRSNAKDFRYGVFPLPIPPGGVQMTVGGGWAFAVNARGKNPVAAAKFCAWALASPQPDSIRHVVDWCTVAKSDMPPRTSAFAAGAAAYNAEPLKTFRTEIYPHTRAEPRVPPPVYKAISDAIQACQLGGRDPATQARQASQTIDDFLATYQGASII